MNIHYSSSRTLAEYYVHIYDRSHVALIAQLGEHCTGIAEVMGSSAVESLIFSGICFSSVTTAFAFDIFIYSIATDEHQLLFCFEFQ